MVADTVHTAEVVVVVTVVVGRVAFISELV